MKNKLYVSFVSLLSLGFACVVSFQDVSAGTDDEFLGSLPEAPEFSFVNPCEDASIEDLRGKIADFKADGRRFKFNPSQMSYNPELEIWYDDQGGSTWTCQLNSNAQPNVNSGDVNLVYNFSYRRSGTERRDAAGRVQFGDIFMEGLESDQAANSCFTCGLVRFKKGCFPPGVKVTLGDGASEKLVEDVASGDELWNPILKKAVKVTTVIEGIEAKPLIKITAGELKLTVSDAHPIYTAEGLKQAKQVVVGDVVYDARGATQNVQEVTSLPVKEGQTVINFTLEESENPKGRLLLADGMVVGDLFEQRQLSHGK